MRGASAGLGRGRLVLAERLYHEQIRGQSANLVLLGCQLAQSGIRLGGSSRTGEHERVQAQRSQVHQVAESGQLNACAAKIVQASALVAGCSEKGCRWPRTVQIHAHVSVRGRALLVL